MIVLACNAGSTSLKFKLYDMPKSTVLATGKVERVGSDNDAIFGYKNVENGFEINVSKQNIPNYEVGIRRFLDCLVNGDGSVLNNIEEIERVGYKLVLSRGHYDVHEMNKEVIDGMHEFYDLAPVHTSTYLNAVETVSKVLPKAKHIGVFETSFHKTIPLERNIYGIPYEWYEKYGIQRMGFHGASHGYIADVLNSEKKNIKQFHVTLTEVEAFVL